MHQAAANMVRVIADQLLSFLAVQTTGMALQKLGPFPYECDCVWFLLCKRDHIKNRSSSSKRDQRLFWSLLEPDTSLFRPKGSGSRHAVRVVAISEKVVQ